MTVDDNSGVTRTTLEYVSRDIKDLREELKETREEIVELRVEMGKVNTEIRVKGLSMGVGGGGAMVALIEIIKMLVGKS